MTRSTSVRARPARWFGGVSGRVTFAVLAVTAVLYSLLATIGFVQIASQGRHAIRERVTGVVDELERSLRSGSQTLSIRTADGVVATARPAGATPPAAQPSEVAVERHVTIGGRSLALVGTATQAPLTDSLRSLYRTLWVGVPLAAVVSALLAGAAARRALRPVAAITQQAASIGTDPAGRRVPVPASGDEIEDLASTVNAMLDRIEAGRAAQRRFTSDAAHELRTPLMALHGEVELARRGVQPLDGQTIDRLDALCRRIGERVDDLVLLATIDEGRPLERNRLDLAEVVTNECATVAPDVRVGTRVRPTIDADPRLIGRAIANLVTNARRHAVATVAVTVETAGAPPGAAPMSVDGGSVAWVHVDDDGPGISPERRSEVFARFSRLDEARSVDAGGAGLGLAIVASVAAAHAGGVVATASPLGGARLSLWLPLAGPAAEPEQPIPTGEAHAPTA